MNGAGSVRHRLACPCCGALLEGTKQRLDCLRGHLQLQLADGVWCADPTEAEERFLESYCQVRRAEGWGSGNPDDLRALPFEDRTGRHPEIWRIRAASYRLLLGQLPGEPGRIVDLGAGNGWLALRLAAKGYRVAAVDLSRDLVDGLGAGVSLPEARQVTWIQSSFDRVPLEAESCDVAIFNGSFHYSSDPERTLREALRLLTPEGQVIVLDSPFYRRARSGDQMLEEREQQWSAAGLQCAGSSKDPIPIDPVPIDPVPIDPAPIDPVPIDPRSIEPVPIGFFTRRRFEQWGHELGIRWRYQRLPLGWLWRMAPYLLPMTGRREPARFPLVLGTRRLR